MGSYFDNGKYPKAVQRGPKSFPDRFRIDRTACWLAGWLLAAGWLAVAWLAGCRLLAAGWLPGCLAGCLVGCWLDIYEGEVQQP